MSEEETNESAWDAQIDVFLEGWAGISVDRDKVKESVLQVQRMKHQYNRFAKITFEDILREVLDELSVRLSSAIWARLPTKVADHVVKCILPTLSQEPERRLKPILSRLSLVCKRWSSYVRPFLFHRLILGRPSDPYFLSAILGSPTSGWLQTHIHTIIFKQSGSLSNPESSRSLPVGALPSLRHISYAYQNRAGGYGPFVPITLRTVWGHASLNLTSLQLMTYRFHSASTLLRMLGALRSLQDVHLYRVSWAVTSRKDTVLQCRADFASIRRVCAAQCTERWPFAWMFAAAGMRHRFKFLRRGETIPWDVVAAVEACNMFDDPQNYVIAVFQKQDQEDKAKDAYTFCFRNTGGDGSNPTPHAFELAFVCSPAPSSASASANRTLHHLFISAAPEISLAQLFAAPWNALDACLLPTRCAITILLDASIAAEDVEAFRAELPRLLPRTSVNVKHGTNLEPVLFARDVRTNDVGNVFAIDPVGAQFRAPKYVWL